MARKFRKRATLLMAALLALSLAACGGGAGGGSSSGSSETGAVSEAGAEGTQDAGAPGEPSEEQKDAAQEEADASAPAVEATLDPSVTYMEGEETVVDTDKLSITVTGYEVNGKNDKGDNVFKVKLRFENNTQGDIELYPEACGVNRLVTYNYNWETYDMTIPAGETLENTLSFNTSQLTAAGITAVDEIIGNFYANVQDRDPEEHYSEGIVFSFYPTGKTEEEIVAANPVAEDDVIILSENRFYRMGILKNNEKTAALSNLKDGIKLIIECRSWEPYRLSVQQMIVNGSNLLADEMDIDDETGETFLPRMIIAECLPFSGCTYIEDFYLLDEDKTGIKSIEDIKEMTMGLCADGQEATEEGWYYTKDEELCIDYVSYNPEAPATEEAEKPKFAEVEYGPIFAGLSGKYFTLLVHTFEPEAYMLTQDGEYKKAIAVCMSIRNTAGMELQIGESVSVNDIDGFGSDTVKPFYGDPDEDILTRLYIPWDELEANDIESLESIRFSCRCDWVGFEQNVAISLSPQTEDESENSIPEESDAGDTIEVSEER